MPEIAGTLPQWGTFAGVLGLLVTALVGLLKHGPQWVQAMNDRARARAAGEDSAAARWKAIEEKVQRELDECRRGREADAAARAADAEERRRILEENFRMRMVMALLLDEAEQPDPGTATVMKAKALLLVIPTEAERDAAPPAVPRLAELLDRIPEKIERRRRRPEPR